MDTKGARTNLALKLAPDDLSSISPIDFPKPNPIKKQYNSELEIYTHSLDNGNFIGIYVHSVRVDIHSALYPAKREVHHTFSIPVERLNELVESALISAGLELFFSSEKASSSDLLAMGIYSYLIPDKHENNIRKALYPYWKKE